MNFTFSEDQLLFRDSVKDFLSNEVTPDLIRSLWESDSGRSEALWKQLAELGLTAMLAPESHDGLGMNEEDFILIAEECGRVALPEPLVENAMVATPLLVSLINLESSLSDTLNDALKKVVSGEAKLAVGASINPFVTDAHIAKFLLLQNDNEVHFLTSDQVTLIEQESVDPSRKLFKVEWTPSSDTCVVGGEAGARLWAETENRGALALAAQLSGLAQQMVSISVEYTSDRNQFGKPIGSFQAVKHHMANVAVKYEFAKAVIYRAANSISSQHPQAAAHVAHAKIAASEAALLAAKQSIQVHGAMGYTWEVNLHIWMKRAWALDNSWGNNAFHKKRIADFALSSLEKIGAGNTF